MADGGPVLGAIDISLMAIYLVAVLAHGLWVGRGERDALDYFLAGRALPWYLIGFSFFASNMSGASFVGLIGASYEHGLVVFNYEWTATLCLIFFAVFMVPVFLRAKIATLPEYLERRFDARSRKAYALFTLVTLLFIDTAGALYAGGIVITVALPGTALWQACAALALLAGIYTIFGGLKSVVVTDATQAVLIIIGASLIVTVGLDRVGGWEAMIAGLAPEKTALLKPADDTFLPWPGILGVIVLGFYYWTLNQYFAQRALGARSLQDARRGALFGGLLKLPNVFLMVVPGMLAIILFPDLASPDEVFPRLAFELLPVGLKGIVLTALVAAIMSSLDSAFNAAASIVTMDFVRERWPDLTGRALLRIGRAVTAAAMLIAAAYAPTIAGFGSLFGYFQSTLSYVVPPIVAVYMIGLFSSRATAGGAFYAIIIGIAVGLPLFVLKEVTGLWAMAGLPPVHYTYMSLFMLGLSASVVVVGTIIGAGTSADRATLVTRDDVGADPDARTDILDYRLLSVLLLLLMAATVAAFL